MYLEEKLSDNKASSGFIPYRLWRLTTLGLGISLFLMLLITIWFDNYVPHFYGWAAEIVMVFGTVLGIILVSAYFPRGFDRWVRFVGKVSGNRWIHEPYSILTFMILVGAFGVAIMLANLVVGSVGKEYTKVELGELVLIVLASLAFIGLGLFSGHRRKTVLGSNKKGWEVLVELVLLISIIISVVSIILFFIQVLSVPVFWVTIIALWLSAYASSDTISREISMQDQRPNN